MTALLEHCQNIYKLMEDESVDGVWEGLTSYLLPRVGLSTSNYNKVFSKLKAMGSIERQRRGGGSSPSVYKLIKFPSHEVYYAATEAGNPEADLTDYKPKRYTNWQGMAAELNKLRESQIILIQQFNLALERITELEKNDILLKRIRGED